MASACNLQGHEQVGTHRGSQRCDNDMAVNQRVSSQVCRGLVTTSAMSLHTSPSLEFCVLSWRRLRLLKPAAATYQAACHIAWTAGAMACHLRRLRGLFSCHAIALEKYFLQQLQVLDAGLSCAGTKVAKQVVDWRLCASSHVSLHLETCLKEIL